MAACLLRPLRETFLLLLKAETAGTSRWVLVCWTKVHAWPYLLPQSLNLHLKPFNFRWTALICSGTLLSHTNDFPQRGQGNLGFWVSQGSGQVSVSTTGFRRPVISMRFVIRFVWIQRIRCDLRFWLLDKKIPALLSSWLWLSASFSVALGVWMQDFSTWGGANGPTRYRDISEFMSMDSVALGVWAQDCSTRGGANGPTRYRDILEFMLMNSKQGTEVVWKFSYLLAKRDACWVCCILNKRTKEIMLCLWRNKILLHCRYALFSVLTLVAFIGGEQCFVCKATPNKSKIQNIRVH